jgi:hypothetical protein
VGGFDTKANATYKLPPTTATATANCESNLIHAPPAFGSAILINKAAITMNKKINLISAKPGSEPFLLRAIPNSAKSRNEAVHVGSKKGLVIPCRHPNAEERQI